MATIVPPPIVDIGLQRALMGFAQPFAQGLGIMGQRGMAGQDIQAIQDWQGRQPARQLEQQPGFVGPPTPFPTMQSQMGQQLAVTGLMGSMFPKPMLPTQQIASRKLARIDSLGKKVQAGTATKSEQTMLDKMLAGEAQVQVFTGDVAASTRAKLEQDIIGLDDTIATLEDIGTTFEPEFQTFFGQKRAGGTAFLERAFNIPPAKTEAFLKSAGITKEADPEFLARYTTFQTTAYERLNQAIKEITGVAVRPEERPRIAKQTVDPAEDSPTQFMKKQEETLRIANQMKKRRLVVLARGQLPTKENLKRISLLQVDKVFEREVGAFTPQPEAINQNNIDAAGKEFGF